MDNYKIGPCWQLLDHIIYICFRPKLSTGDLLSSFDMPLKEILQLSRVMTCVGEGRLPDEGEHKFMLDYHVLGDLLVSSSQL